MSDFHNLQKILEMDFTQMRALPCPGGKRASDEAIYFFVNNLISFFSQFTKTPTQEELANYLTYMKKITDKINESEYAYYLDKYTSEYESYSEAEVSASICRLKSFKDISKRMQYWAASETWGDAIRNASKHALAVKNLDKWASYIDKYSWTSFFQSSNDESTNSEESKLKPGF